MTDAQLVKLRANQQFLQEQREQAIANYISKQNTNKTQTTSLNSSQLDTNLQERLCNRLKFFNILRYYNMFLVLLFGLFLLLLGVLRETDEIKNEGPSKETIFIFVISGIFLVFLILYVFVFSEKKSDDDNLKAALNLTDSMTNLYQARTSANDLSSSMATILTPNFSNQKQYDNFKQTVANHYSDVPNQVQSNVIKATYNAVQPAESQP